MIFELAIDAPALGLPFPADTGPREHTTRAPLPIAPFGLDARITLTCETCRLQPTCLFFAYSRTRWADPQWFTCDYFPTRHESFVSPEALT